MPEENLKKVRLICIHDIVEENGKTIKENNLEKTHNIPIGSLVEFKTNVWHGDGACELIHGRFWVHSHDRDCDGTPLYSLSPHRVDLYEGAEIHLVNEGYKLKEYITHTMLNNIRSGFPEESLKKIEVTPELEYGHGSLEWDDKNV